MEEFWLVDEDTEYCSMCGFPMTAEHAHYRCSRCGYRDTCCEGVALF